MPPTPKEEPEATWEEKTAELQDDFETIDELVGKARMGEGKAELTFALLHMPEMKKEVHGLMEQFRILRRHGGVPEGSDRIKRMEFEARKIIDKVRELTKGNLTPP